MCTEPVASFDKGEVPFKDMYQQQHPDETDDIIKEKLAEFEAALQKLPDEEYYWVQQPEEKCPELVGPKFKLLFLRAEVLKVPAAVQRYAKYWEKRIELCGPEKAFLPLTFTGAFKDDFEVCVGADGCILPSRDPMGRAISYIHVGKKDPATYTKEEATRVVWYHLHAAIESEEAQKHGIVSVILTNTDRLFQFDRSKTAYLIKALVGVIPVRMAAFHILKPPGILRFITPFICLFLSDRLKGRMQFHFGNDEQNLKQLARFGLSEDKLPREIGGTLDFDHSVWLNERRNAGK